MIEHDVTETLDVQGQNCPMPVVKTKQTIDLLDYEAEDFYDGVGAATAIQDMAESDIQLLI